MDPSLFIVNIIDYAYGAATFAILIPMKLKKVVIVTHWTEDFLDTLDARTRERFDTVIQALKQDGLLTYPSARKLQGYDNLFEIRIRSPWDGQVRVFYAYADCNAIYTLNGFIKKTQETPLKELRLAKTIMKEIGL